MPKAYEPAEVEKKWYQFWLEQKLFHAPDVSKKKSYSIVIPPPNVTGALHMGHALNNTLQDILIRWKRMQGFSALWMPGTDHAGIATQNVVERELKKSEGKTRHDLGREGLIRRIWQWKEQYGNRILDQLKGLGASCDWDRTRFTLDEGLSHAVRECFVTLYNCGLIYRGKYIVHWCPRCQTALADDEVEHEERKTSLWHLRYPFLTEDRGQKPENRKLFLVVATTRPETMLGDTAVAVNPKDKRYKNFVGKKLLLPEVGREIPVIADNFVDQKFGTGCVKVTPAHDPNDFQMGLRHDLPQINVMNGDGTMSDAVPEKYRGLTREECRKKIVEAFEAQGLLEKIEDHTNSVGHCYRCNTVVEPWLSDQWFVKMKPLAQKAMAATRQKKVQFFPKRWEKFYLQWLHDVRDWCISRQIWWGHRIPVWYCCTLVRSYARTLVPNHQSTSVPEYQRTICPPIVAMETPTKCPQCGGKNLKQDEDVLDTWFSSGLWPFSTFGWPEKTKALQTYYPTSTLVTDRGIIFFWVARMVMMGMELVKKVPFRHVYINGTVLDIHGRKMSKSHPETCIDPMDVIQKYGADAVRYSLVLLATEGQDLKLSEDRFEMGKHFCNKLWNASRFAMMNLNQRSAVSGQQLEKKLTLADQWILNRLQHTVNTIHEALENYQFHVAGQALYRFVWNEFCDWYLEWIKPFVQKNEATQETLRNVLESILRLGHPFLPFITEEIWQALRAVSSDTKNGPSIMTSAYPKPQKKILFFDAVRPAEIIQEIVTALRNLRAERGVKPGQKIPAFLFVSNSKMRCVLRENEEIVYRLAQVEKLIWLEKKEAREKCAVVITKHAEIQVPFSGLFNAEEERSRLLKEMEKTELEEKSIEGKLSNENFVQRAPKEIVEKERERLSACREKLGKLREAMHQLQNQ